MQEAPDSLRRLPVFALPEVVLFPHTLVPFHVFEARYRAMLDDCLVGRRLLIVAGLRPGWRSGPMPPVHEVAGLGRVLSDRRFHDGRYNIFVHCIGRVRILRHIDDAEYAMADVAPLEDLPDSDDAAPLEAAYRRLVSVSAGLMRARGDGGEAMARVLASTSDPAVLSHRLASVVLDDALERQRTLEMRSPLARCELLVDRLSRALIATEQAAGDEAPWIN